MQLVLDGAQSTSSVTCLAIEQVIGCNVPVFPQQGHSYTAGAAAIAINGNQVQIVYTRDPANAPACSLVFNGTQNGLMLSGTLFWQRIDQPAPLNWSASTSISLAPDPPTIQGPSDVTICATDSTAPSNTGFPFLTSSCSPANQVQFNYSDSVDFSGNIQRTWTATDPLCGSSAPWFQSITLLQQDNPTTIFTTSSADGLITTFQAAGTRGSILSSTWFANGNQLFEGNGVHFIDAATVQIDFSQYQNGNITPGNFFSVNVNVSTSCSPGGGAGTGASAPPVYTLSRSANPITVGPSAGNAPLNVQCGSGNASYSASSRWFAFQATDNGVAVVTVSSATAHSVTLTPGASLLQPTALACGIPGMIFPAQVNSLYVIVVDSAQTFTITTQIVDPTRVIGLSGNLSFGPVPLGTPKTASLVITNSGNSALTVNAVTFPAGFTGNWSGGSIPPGGSQNVTVTFNPSAQTSYSGNIVIASDATSGTASIAVSGSGTVLPTRIIGLSGNLSFGGVQVGTSATAALTLTNSGNATLTVSSLAFPTGFSGNWAGGTIASKASRTVIVTFSPAATISYSGNITVTSDATSGVNTIPVSGVGTPIPTRIIALNGNLNFGKVQTGSVATATLVISNSGNSPLAVTGFNFPPGFGAAWSGAVPPGGSQNVVVNFSPAAPIPYSGNLTVVSDATSGANTFPVSGFGTTAPTRIISLSGNLDFGSVQAGLPKTTTLVIANTGTATLNVSGITLPNGFNASWTAGSIPAGGSQSVTITFAPFSAQSYGGTLTVLSDATGGGNALPISGSGSQVPTRIIGLSGVLAFGNVTVGSTAVSTLSIANTGNSVLNVSGVNFPAGFSGNWSGGPIVPGGMQNVVVTFAPTTVAAYSGSLNVVSDASSGVSSFPLSGAGTEPPSRIISLSGNLAFGNVPVGSTAPAVLKIANGGNSPLTVSSISFPSGFSGNWPGGLIPAGGSQNVTVTFSPAATSAYAGTVTVASDATGGGNSVPISGTGVPADTRIIALSGNLAFGSVPVGSTKTSTLIIENKGNTTLHISAIAFPPGLSGNWVAGAIAPGAAQSVLVTFAPLEVKNYGGNLVVTSDATSGGNVFVAFASGIMAAPSAVSLSGNLNFGNVVVGSTRSLIFSILNPGQSPLHVNGVSVPPGFTADWTVGQINPGGSQNVTVTFAPTAPLAYAGSVVVASDAASGSNSLPIVASGFAAGFAAADLDQPSNGNFRLSLNAPPGKTLILEASDDLRTWTRIATLQSQRENVVYQEELPTGAASRFYRFHEQ